MSETFQDLVDGNEELGFYGVDGDCFKLGPRVYRAVENPVDGYRSMLKDIETVEDPEGLVFFPSAVDVVKVVTSSQFKAHGVEGYEVVSTLDGHVWLRVGTGNASDWYPYYVFSYAPRTPPQTLEEVWR
jgi:hypothetical protein